MADAFFTEQHELVRKLAREFAETELTKEILDKVEEEEVFPEEIPVSYTHLDVYKRQNESSGEK